jgi:hypothetical protein
LHDLAEFPGLDHPANSIKIAAQKQIKIIINIGHCLFTIQLKIQLNVKSNQKKIVAPKKFLF